MKVQVFLEKHYMYLMVCEFHWRFEELFVMAVAELNLAIVE